MLKKHKKQCPEKSYPVAITPVLKELIEAEGGDGPVSRQFMPSDAELDYQEGEMQDPLGDDRHSPVPGIIHRYPDRVLLKPTHQCAVYCRFCFRREMVGPGQGRLDEEGLNRALAYIRNTPEIWEVILTGGDPLVLSPLVLSHIMYALEDIAHVRIIRIHTRLPVAAPKKIDARLLEVMEMGKSVWLSVHCNHVTELTDEVCQSFARIQAAGIQMVSQSVLLKGVNNTVEDLENLFRRLVELNVKPYYLHHCDMAPGTAHFRTTIKEGKTLMADLRKRLSGLALPTYMYEIPGGDGKFPL